MVSDIFYSDVQGAVAQLGERLHGMQEVVSSNLIGSIFVTIYVTGSYIVYLSLA